MFGYGLLNVVREFFNKIFIWFEKFLLCWRAGVVACHAFLTDGLLGAVNF